MSIIGRKNSHLTKIDRTLIGRLVTKAKGLRSDERWRNDHPSLIHRKSRKERNWSETAERAIFICRIGQRVLCGIRDSGSHRDEGRVHNSKKDQKFEEFRKRLRGRDLSLMMNPIGTRV